jgi:hypothetical protein
MREVTYCFEISRLQKHPCAHSALKPTQFFEEEKKMKSKRHITKANKQKLSILLLILSAGFWSVPVISEADESPITVYQGSFPTNQSWSDSFQWAPPSDGKLILTIDNPDATNDGLITILDGTAWNTGQNLIFNPVIRQGVQQSIFEADVKQSWGFRPWLWLKDSSPNAGADVLTLQFVSNSVSNQSKSYLGSLTSTAFQQNSDSWSFDLDDPGKLLFNVAEYGGGGGSHSVYIDNLKVMELRLGWGDPGATAPVWSSIAIPAGQHTVRLSHEDDYWPDNYGTRQTQVYLVPEPTTLMILALGGLFLRRKK